MGFGVAWQARLKAHLILFSAGFACTLVLGFLLQPLFSLPARLPHLPPSYRWLERRLRILMRFDGRMALLLILLGAGWNGWITAQQWPQWLLFIHGDNWGYQAPFWMHDVSWWIFRLPFWMLLLDAWQRALWLVLLCGLLLVLGRGAARFLSRHPALPSQALRGLVLLGITLFLVR